MNTYRPDLANSLSRADLLALRFDPTISREMVSNLAREGEAYLKARGHHITAGRLYLCHFLGMQGAAVVLSASPNAMLVDVLGRRGHTRQPIPHGKKCLLRTDLGGEQDAPQGQPRRDLGAINAECGDERDQANIAGV